MGFVPIPQVPDLVGLTQDGFGNLVDATGRVVQWAGNQVGLGGGGGSAPPPSSGPQYQGDPTVNGDSSTWAPSAPTGSQNPPPSPAQITKAQIDVALQNGNAYRDSNGDVQMYVVPPGGTGSGSWETFAQGANGDYVLSVPAPKAAGGTGTDNTVGMANVGLGYAQLAQSGDQFQQSQGQQNAQFQQTFAQGQAQFDATYQRSAFESDRAYQMARDQYAQSFAENARQFDATNSLDTQRLGLDTTLGMGNLAVNQGQLALDDRLGTGRLALDTELGRGNLAVSQGDLAVNQGQLALNDRLGTGRLALDTQTDQGNLRLGAERLGFDKQSADRTASLAENQFRADVLRNPSDYVFRAFESRGENAPDAKITQADILNTLANGASGGTPAPAPSVGHFAEGGVATDPYFVAGERGPELIANHGDGSFSVANAGQTQRLLGPSAGGMGEQQNGRMAFMHAARNFDPRAMMQQYIQRSRLGGGMSTGPTTGFGDAPQQTAWPQVGTPAMSRFGHYAAGTGDPFFDEMDSLSNYTPQPVPRFTQDELVGAAQRYSPPAVSSVIGGQDPNTYRPYFSNLTPGRINELTPGEQAALSTRLAIQGDTTLADEQSGLNSRFGRMMTAPSARMAV